jgi:V/A-type H+-transporting ATPase subunit I
MALLKMKKLTLIAHASGKDAILKKLQSIGAVEITVSKHLEELRVAESLSLPELETRLSQVREALETIRRYDENKPSFLTPKPSISISALHGMNKMFSEADEAVSKIKQFSDDMNSLKARRQRIKTRIAQLEPYMDFDAPLECVAEGVYTEALIGSIPADNAQDYYDIAGRYKDEAYFEKISENRENIFVWVVMHKDIHEKLTGELKYIGFSEGYTKDSYGVPKDIIFDLRNEFDSLKKETDEYEEKAKRFADDRELLASFEDYLTNEMERERSIGKIGETGAAFLLEGWIIADNEKQVAKALLETAPESYIAFRSPEKGEIPPTAVDNPRPVEPFEAVTDMYAVPSSRGVDPNIIMSIFYFLIFGMMIGDAAYGVILSLGALLILKLKKPAGMFRKITTVVMICGLSTLFWGLMFGTVFSIKPVTSIAVIDINKDPITLLVLCLAVGVLHIFAGLVIGMYKDIKQGRFWAAIFDRFSWILLVSGIIMLLLGGAVGAVGQYMAAAGLLILLLTQGREKKGIIRKAIGGLSSIYGVTGYVSDILSYCRIFGMGLATTVIAQVFNTIAGMLMGQALGYIFSVIILIVGHTFNIAINTLGAFVHTARLQYIEFFSKFYEGGGHAFAPLAERAKNHRLVD